MTKPDTQRPEYEELVPELRQLTDFMEPYSEEEEDFEEGTVTKIGLSYQASVPRYGTISRSSNKGRMIWDSKRLHPEVVKQYLVEAKKLWKSSYLDKLMKFNEQDACMILHVKKYNVQKALEAVVHQRLPYIALIDLEKSRKQEDLRALKNGEDLMFND